MIKVVVPALAALALTAFAVQTNATDDQGADGAGWHLSHEDDMAKLAYGMPNSDQLALMMTCSPGDAEVVIYGDMKPDTPRLVRASMGPHNLDPLSAGDFEESTLPLNDAALRGLVEGRALPVRGEAGEARLTASDDERHMAATFLAYCGSTRA
jgi:hypothetical protein